MSKYIFIFLLALIILAGCDTEIPDYEWCYIYAFVDNDYGFNIAEGAWSNEVGFYTVDDEPPSPADLSISYSNPFVVSPAFIQAFVIRRINDEEFEGATQIQVAGNVYGIESEFTGEFSSGFESAIFTPETIGDGGNAINITIARLDDDPVDFILSALGIYGNGSNPFGENHCIDDFPTLAPTNPPTYTPFNTASPTITNTATNTYTPTATETPIPGTPTEFCQEFDFTTNQYTDYVSVVAGRGTYTGATGYRSVVQTIATGDDAQILNLEFNFSSRVITSVRRKGTLSGQRASTPNTELDYVISPDPIVRVNQATGAFDTTASIASLTSSEILVYVVGGNNASVYNFLTEVEICGDGSNPFTSLSTPTATSTNTPTATLTPSKTSSPTRTPTPLTTPISGGGSGTATRTPIGYNSPTPIPTVNLTTNPATSTGTPYPTNTAYPTYTHIPSYTPWSTWTAIPGTAQSEWDFENEAEYQILGQQADFFSWIQNMLANLFGFLAAVFNAIINAIAGFFRLIADLINFLFNLLSAIINFILEVIAIILLIVNLILGLIGLMLTWMGQAIARLIVLITAFFTAPATPIPGLPQCVSAPLAHDLCAIYYIMDWTLFEPQTAGTFIIPLVLTMMNVIIIFRFVRYVMKLIRKGEDATNF